MYGRSVLCSPPTLPSKQAWHDRTFGAEHIRHVALLTAAKSKTAQYFAHVAAAKIIFKDLVTLITRVCQSSGSTVCPHITFMFHVDCSELASKDQLRRVNLCGVSACIRLQ